MGKSTLIICVIIFLLCQREVIGIYWPCETNNDCTAEGSICSDSNECECEDFNTLFNSNYTKCVKPSQIGDSCEDIVQCNLMPTGAHCNSEGICDCADGYTYIRGRCRDLKYLNEHCETDLDCYFAYDRNSVQCNDNVCTCANGYYHRNGNICRRKSMDIKDACVVNADCQELGENVKCISLMCQYADEKDRIVDHNANPKAIDNVDGNINKNNNKFNNENDKNANPKDTSITTKGEQRTLISKSDTDASNFQLDNINDRQRLVNVYDATTNTEDINEESFNSIQAIRTQRLREIAVQTSIEGYELKSLDRFNNAPILKNVGTTTASTSTNASRRRPSRYSRYRRPSSFYRHNLDDDEKTFSTVSNTDDDADDKKFGSFCAENGKVCSGMPHSLCSNNMCLCKQGYYNKNDACFAELGEIAESVDECEHSFDSVTKKCNCQKNYFFERNLRSCRKPIQIHLSCTSNSQCSPFGASFCHPEIPRRCTCQEYAEYDDLLQMCTFKQGLGSECDTNEGCPVTNSICLNRHCVCKESYMAKEETCVPGLGASCTTDANCENVENGICVVDESTNGSGNEEKDKTCQCRKGFVHFKDECLKEAVNIDDECEENDQCKPLLGTCIEKKCSCTSEQHFRFGKCENKKKLGESCDRVGECFVEGEKQDVECRNSFCQCRFDYTANKEKTACIRVTPNKKNSSGRPSALKIITFILIGSAFLITSAAIKQAYY